MTNFDTQGQYYRKYEDVLHLQIVSGGRNHLENTVRTDVGNDLRIDLTRISFVFQNQPMNSDLFPKAGELFVAMDRFNTLGSVPPGLDLLNVTKLSLSLSSIPPEDEMLFAGLRSLLRQTSNIDSLEFSGPLFVQIYEKPIVQISLTIIDSVDPLKLHYLTIPVIGVHHVKTLLKTFRALLRIKFDLRGLWTEYGEIVKYLRTLTRDYSIHEDESSMFVEMCRHSQTTNIANESNGINRRETRRLSPNRNQRTSSFPRWEIDSVAERTENTSMDWN